MQAPLLLSYRTHPHAFQHTLITCTTTQSKAADIKGPSPNITSPRNTIRILPQNGNIFIRPSESVSCPKNSLILIRFVSSQHSAPLESVIITRGVHNVVTAKHSSSPSLWEPVDAHARVLLANGTSFIDRGSNLSPTVK